MEAVMEKISIHLPTEAVEKVDALRAKEKRKRSQMIAVLVEEALAAREKKGKAS